MCNLHHCQTRIGLRKNSCKQTVGGLPVGLPVGQVMASRVVVRKTKATEAKLCMKAVVAACQDTESYFGL